MPSLNQIKEGLIAEAMVQLKLAMGNVKDQNKVELAMKNIRETWEELIDQAEIEDKDEPLRHLFSNGDFSGGILEDPTSSEVALILYIYQMENFCFSELNRACRFKDETKVKTLGPWAAALYYII